MSALRVTIDPQCADAQTRQRIRAAIEEMFREREGDFAVTIESPLSHKYRRLTLSAKNRKREMLLDGSEVQPGNIAGILARWLAEWAV